MNNRLTRVMVYAAITGIVILAMTACDWTGSEKHTNVSYAIGQPVKTLVVQGQTGNVRVVGGGDAVTVTEHQNYKDQQPATTHQVSADGTLTLAYHCQDCGVGYEVHVPAGTVVKVTDQTGELAFSGLTADVQGTTETGDINATRLSGGKVELRTETGNVTAGFNTAPTAVDANAETGSIRISVPGGTGYTVSAGTQTGSVNVAVPQDSAGRTIDAHAETGNVAVTGA